MINWQIDDDGMIAQSISDIQDSSYKIFGETARIHNQVIHDKKNKDG